MNGLSTNDVLDDCPAADFALNQTCDAAAALFAQ
jgi:hypothetical protein